MFRKALFSLCCVAMLVMASGAVPVFASGSTTSMEKVFTPASATENMTAMHEFQSSLYVSVSDEVIGGQIWRSKDGNSWEPATDLGFGINLSYTDSWSMTIFNGKLYVAANCFPTRGPDCPGMVLRTADGIKWEKIPLATGTSLLDKLGVFGGMIYATSIWSGGQIWRSFTGNPGTWEAVKNFGLGDGFGTSAPIEYKDQVYFTESSGGDSEVIWHSADGRHWNTNSLKLTDQDPSTGFIGEATLVIYHDVLYMAVTNSIDGGTIYRTIDGKHWEKVVDQTPYLIGFRDLIEYNGDLYVTVFGFDGTNFGLNLWRSHSGNLGSWKVVNLDPPDWGANSGSDRGTLAILEGSLYSANLGGSVFRMNTH